MTADDSEFGTQAGAGDDIIVVGAQPADGPAAGDRHRPPARTVIRRRM